MGKLIKSLTTTQMIDYFDPENFIDGTPKNQEKIIDIIKSDRFKSETDICRNKLSGVNNKDDRRKFKTSNFSLVTFAGTFKRPRSKANLKVHSGQASIDFDEYDKTKSDLLFEQLKKDKYMHILFRSPSYGLKAVIKIPVVTSDEEYKEYFYALIKYYSKYSPTQDTGCADISRLCFLSYDPDLYQNNKSEMFTGKAKKEEKIKIKKTKEKIPEHCKFIEEITTKHILPSGEKTRHAYLDGNVWKYCSSNNREDVLIKYMNAQGRTKAAFNNANKFVFSCGTIRKYLQSNKEGNGYILEGLKICDKCNCYLEFKEASKELRLPGKGRLISEVANELGDIFTNKSQIFYKPQENSVVEIRKLKHKEDGNEEFLGFNELNCNRFITTLEKYVIPGVEKYIEKEDRTIFEQKSMSKSHSEIILESETFQNSLPIIKRLFTVPIPIIHEGNITFPKKGYDKRFLSWLPHDSPEIDKPEMSKKEAINIVSLLFREFPFQNHEDFINAISGLLTPFLRGLYSNFNVRTPIYFYIANRERAGKDYCAGITGILYEGNALEEPPISGADNFGSNREEELRKKLLSAFISGRKRLHFANNKGCINNSVFEQVTTSTRYSDRVLGKSQIITIDNEIEFSLSGNIGVSYTPDFFNRCRFVRLMLDIENANLRNFKNPNLHDWVFRNRNMILSALYALVKDWYNNGMKKGSIPFTSFPEWAAICGGIMENAGFDNPCQQKEDNFNVSGDYETENMKSLYECVYEVRPEEFLKKSEIRAIIELDEEYSIFGNFDFTHKSDQIKFGIVIDKFINRMFSDIRLVSNNHKRSARREYKLTKSHKQDDQTKIFGSEIEVQDIETFDFQKSEDLAKKPSGNVGNVGNVPPTQLRKKNFSSKWIGVYETLPTLPTLPLLPEKSSIGNEGVEKGDIVDTAFEKVKYKGLALIQDLINATGEFGEQILKHKIEKGEYFEPKRGYVSKT